MKIFLAGTSGTREKAWRQVNLHRRLTAYHYLITDRGVLAIFHFYLRYNKGELEG